MNNSLTRLLHSCRRCVSNSTDCYTKLNRLSIQTSHIRGYCYERRTNPDVAPGGIHNVQSIRSKWAEHFKYRDIPEPEASAELIVAHILGCKTLSGIASWQILSKSKIDKINDLCALRLKRMPVQYVIKEWDFRDLVLQMEPPVLIPRPETEELITHIKNYQTIQDLSPPDKILEIGCGSGAVILSLAKEYPESFCLGIDRCSVACHLTRKNANNHALDVYIENVEFTDRAVKDKDILQSKFDLIVSNPPYISTSDLKSLAPEILEYEDVSGALHGGTHGLDVVEVILRNSQHILNSNGLLWLEVDSTHPKRIRALTEENYQWKLKYIKTYKDFMNKPRFCLLSHTSN